MPTKAKPIGVAGTKPGFLKSSVEVAMEQIEAEDRVTKAQREREEQRAAEAEAKGAIKDQRAARAGLDVTWKHGEPWFTETPGAFGALSEREKAVERWCRQLEAENTKLRDQLESAARRDDEYKDQVRKQAEAYRKYEEQRKHERAKQADAEAYADLLAGGATVADIEALEKLTGKTGVELRDHVQRPKTPPTLGVSYRGQDLGGSMIPQAFLADAAKRLGESAGRTMDSVIGNMIAKGTDPADILIGQQLDVQISRDLDGNMKLGWTAKIGERKL